MAHDAVKVLDYKGLPCPMPVVKISQDIGTIELGQVVEVNTTDPGSIPDFDAWARTTGQEVVECIPGEVIKIYVKRNK